MIYVEAPSDEYLTHMVDSSCKWLGKKSVFLAGGIMMCLPWQDKMAGLLASEEDLVLLNPRRKSFPMDDPSESERQIAWEHQHLELADAILFWFSPPTHNPIVFYELGKFIDKKVYITTHKKLNFETKKPIFIGVHPDFERKEDVRIQTGLVRPDLKIVDNLEELAEQVKTWLGQNKNTVWKY